MITNIKEFIAPSEHYSLLPCPFCGSKEVTYYSYLHQCGSIRYAVFCTGCTASIDPGYAQDLTTVQRKWNARSKEAVI